MIRPALFAIVVAIAVAVAVVMLDRPTETVEPPRETPREALTTRFPDGWDTAPVIEYKKPETPWPSAVSQLSPDEFAAAVAAVERLRPPPPPPQPADAVFNDAQIASIRDRLALTPEQQPYWHAVAATLREVVWDRRRGHRPRPDAASLARFQEAAAPFFATLSAKQRAEIEALAHIVGLRLDLSAAR